MYGWGGAGAGAGGGGVNAKVGFCSRDYACVCEHIRLISQASTVL